MSSFERVSVVVPRSAWVTIAASLLAASAVAVAWAHRFVLDDAFISFTYARNLVEGLGLTWFGERVEGYTNFLWVLWLALGSLVRIDPVAFSIVSGLVAFLVAMALLWRLAAMTFGELALRLATIAIFAFNYSVLAFATSGLETMAQTAAVLAGLWLLARLQASDRSRAKEATALGVVSALALMLRLDSALPFAILLLSAVVTLRRTSGLKYLPRIAIPLVLLVGVWLAWKLSYYGRILPNSFYAKVGEGTAETGWAYIARFLSWYAFWPVLVLGLVATVYKRRRLDPIIATSGAIVAAWCAYMAIVGGDFMEFRMMVPMVPLLALLVGHSLRALTVKFTFPWRLITVTAVCMTLIGASVLHGLAFRTMQGDFTLDSVDYLRTFYGLYGDGDFSPIGERLGSDLAGTGASIAVHPAGAIPYYSRLPTIDMWGLNDLKIPIEGAAAPASYRRPGHRRHATLEYLRQRSVTFIIGHPTLIRRGALSSGEYGANLNAWLDNVVTFNTEPIDRAVLVAAPINENDALLMWYLTPALAIDERIRVLGWETVTLE